MKGIVLLVVAVALSLILMPIGFIFSIVSAVRKKRYSKYLSRVAVSLDQHANCVCEHLLNIVLIKSEDNKFGNEDETISSVLGKNKLAKTLTVTGIILVWILGLIDDNHSINSIDKTE